MAETPVCRHWLQKGACRYADHCKFTHPDAAACGGDPDADADDNDDAHPSSSACRRTSSAGNDLRHAAVRRFLVDSAALCAGDAAVVDVAGGRGEVSIELLNLHGIACTVVDPRDGVFGKGLKKYARRARLGLLRVGPPAAAVAAAEPPPPVVPQAPVYCRAFVTEALLDRAAAVRRGDSGGEDGGAEQAALFARHRCRDTPVRGRVDVGEVPSDAAAAAAARAACRALGECTFVVAVHPDEATEPVLDWCLAERVSFLIVPCCVFPDACPQRRLRCGTPVRTYAQFLDYLQAKDPASITRHALPISGRNVALFASFPRAAATP